jgi:acyl-CoA thioesterase
MAERTPQQTADLVHEGMLRNDRATKWLGMQIVDVQPGSATITMAVRDEMLNGHDLCHGGLIATLADSTFAFACNSYDELTVASGFGIDFVAPGRLHDVLTARCTEVSKAGRTGVYDCEVTNQRGERIAVFRGRSYTMKGKPAVPVHNAGGGDDDARENTRPRRARPDRDREPRRGPRAATDAPEDDARARL